MSNSYHGNGNGGTPKVFNRFRKTYHSMNLLSPTREEEPARSNNGYSVSKMNFLASSIIIINSNTKAYSSHYNTQGKTNFKYLFIFGPNEKVLFTHSVIKETLK